MKDILTSFEGMDEFIKRYDKGYLGGLRAYYRMVGVEAGYSVVEGAQIIRECIDFGKADMAFIEPNIIFGFEFGILDDAFKHLYRFMIAEPKLGVMVTSSRSSLKPERVRQVIDGTRNLRDMDIIVLDTEKKTAL